MQKVFEWFLPIKKDDGMVLRGIRAGETAPVVRFHLIDEGGKGADITGCTAISCVVARCDGDKVVMTLPVSSILCEAPAVLELSFEDARLTAVPGLCEGTIELYADEYRMTCARFRYFVESGINVKDDEVASDVQYSMFVGAMTDLAKLNNDVANAEAARVGDEAERVLAENARAVFEMYDPEKEYVKGNKVAFEGSSYILVAERSKGENPADAEVWLLIAVKGDKGDKGDKGEQGLKGNDGSMVYTYALGLGKDIAVGYEAVLPDELLGRVQHLDLVIDTEGGCVFQYKAYEGDDEGGMPAESFRCVANPNGKDGKNGVDGKDGTNGKDGKDGVDGKDAVVDKQLSHDSENAIANKAVNEKISEIFSVMSAIEGTSARTDLSNVSNEDFAAKANAAGVGGGASGAVVFKGVVSELPYNAKNGEMYKLGADIIDTKNYHNNGTAYDYYTDYISETKVVFSGENEIFNILKEAFERGTGRGEVMFDNGMYWEGFYFTVSGVEDSSYSIIFSNVDGERLQQAFSSPIYEVNLYDMVTFSKGTCAIFHNGEWV